MTILHVTPCLAPAWAYGRVAQDVAALARAQAAAGHTVVVLTTDALAPHERLAAGTSVVDDVRVVRVRNLTGAVRTWLDVSSPIGFARHARHLLAAHTVDVVHLHELATVENLAVLGVLSDAVPVVVSPHDTAGLTARRGRLRARWDRRVLARVCRRAAAVMASSRAEVDAATAAWASASCGAPPRVVVIPRGVTLLPGVDPERRDDADARSREPQTVLFVGRLSTPSPLASLLPAFAELRQVRPSLRLHVAGGDHDGRAETEALAHALDLAPAITWLGHVPHDRLPAHLAAADVLALPSNADPYGDVAGTALAVGTSVVVHADEGDVRTSDRGPLTAVSDTIEAWRSGLAAHLDAHAHSAALRQAARAVAARCTWPAVAEAVVEEYRAVANTRRG